MSLPRRFSRSVSKYSRRAEDSAPYHLMSSAPNNAIWVHSALDDLGLTPSQFRVYAHLSRRAGNGVAWPAIASIARVCRLSRNTVIAALHSLERRGLLQVERNRGGAPNHYRRIQIGQWPKTAERQGSPRTQLKPDTTQRNMSTGNPPKTDTEVIPKEVLEGYPLRKSMEGNPLRRSREGVSQPAASLNYGVASSADTKTFWMLIKQIECNAELIKAVERRGLLDENDKWIFNNPADRDEYRRLKAERKALLERTRPAGVERVKT